MSCWKRFLIAGCLATSLAFVSAYGQGVPAPIPEPRMNIGLGLTTQPRGAELELILSKGAVVKGKLVQVKLNDTVVIEEPDGRHAAVHSADISVVRWRVK